MSRLAGSGYFIGLGSNLDCERNAACCLEYLLRDFPLLLCSRFIYTPPYAVQSPQWFLNAVLFVPTDMAATALKARCNHIEISLGRDRAHPLRKYRDRAVDLDILHYCKDVSDCHDWVAQESYLRASADELLAYIQQRNAEFIALRCAYLYLQNQSLGHAPATIYRDDRSGLIRIFQ